MFLPPSKHLFSAGKSTLLKALVPERPVEISPIQFTTKHPQVCHLEFGEKNPDPKKKEVISLKFKQIWFLMQR
jgi:ribosome-binding ATPase YchF (GTP1/OBG family)